MYHAKVLADSTCERQHRLITIEATFPRFILAEVNTHRVFSRNSASSRAIPPEKLIDKVIDDPFIPEIFNERVKGMGIGKPLSQSDQATARTAWCACLDQAISSAYILIALKADKSRINRLLEPFMWHTAIITATEWENFFALRCPPSERPTEEFPAQWEFQRIAIEMRRVMRESKPRFIKYGEWHLPLVTDEEYQTAREQGLQFQSMYKELAMVSAGRCARVSFDRHGEYEPRVNSFNRAEMLLDSGHLSPLEHQARPAILENAEQEISPDLRSNLVGWVQHRKLVPHETNRVGHLEQRQSWEIEEVPA